MRVRKREKQLSPDCERRFKAMLEIEKQGN